MKEQAIQEKMKLVCNGISVLYETEKRHELGNEKLNTNMVKWTKTRVKIVAGEKLKIREMTKQEHLGNKLSEKLQFPQIDFHYL